MVNKVESFFVIKGFGLLSSSLLLFPVIVSIDILYRVRTDWIFVVKISETKLGDFYH